MAARRGRLFAAGPRALVALAALLVALAATGCGVQEHANDPRPAPPTRVSVSITEDGITVVPRRIGIGPQPTQQIPQNRDVEQPPMDTDAPLDVVLVAANLTTNDARLVVRGRGAEAESEALVANGNISLQTALPTGLYVVSAPGVPDSGRATLAVGPYRASSDNDVLLP